MRDPEVSEYGVSGAQENVLRLDVAWTTPRPWEWLNASDVLELFVRKPTDGGFETHHIVGVQAIKSYLLQ